MPGNLPVTGLSSGYTLHRKEGVQLILAERGEVLGRVTQLSPTAVWVQPGKEARRPQLERQHWLCLEAGGTRLGPLRGEPRWGGGREAEDPLGLRLLDVPLEQGRRVLALLEEAARRGTAEPESSPLPVQEEISHRERILERLTAVCVLGRRGVLRRPGHTQHVVLEHVDAGRGLLHWRCTSPEAGWGTPPYMVEVEGDNALWRMSLPGPAARGAHLVTPLPEHLWRVRHRWHRRVPAPPGLRARFLHPLWSELGPREHAVVELSFSGLSLRGGPEALVFPGLFLPLELEMEDGEPLRLLGEVRHVSTSSEDGKHLFGLEVQPRSEEERLRWMRLVSQSLCPTTRTSEMLLEPLWEAYAASGYFHLAGDGEGHFDGLRRDFLELGRRAAGLPHLVCQTVWPSERGVEASLSALKPYRHAWMLHQLARKPGRPDAPLAPGQILRDTYLRTVEHTQGDPELRWLFCYGESTVPWIARTHLRFAQGRADALVMPLRLMDASCDEPSGQSAEELDIGPATSLEKDLLAREISRTRPPCYVEALDFSRERLELREATQTWHEAGLERERRLLVARRGGVPLAALVLELGHPGTNLFRLLDAARLFPLAPCGRVAYVALLDEARRWFALRGRSAFVYLCEDDGDYAAAARLHDDPRTRPSLWIIPAPLVPEFLEHLTEKSIGRPLSPTES